MMELITTRDLIVNAAERWRDVYHGSYGWAIYSRPDAQVVYEKLRQLSSDATEQDVENIIGTSFYTKLECDECGQRVETIIRFGGSFTPDKMDICLVCLKQAIMLTEGTAA